MPFTYDGKVIQPVSGMNMVKEYTTTEDGEVVGSQWAITVKGSILAGMGSPFTNQTFWTLSTDPPQETIADTSKMAALLRKQEAIRQLFATHGLVMELTPWDGSPPLKFNPRINRLNFVEGLWYDRMDWQLECAADVIYINGLAQGEDAINTYKVSRASDEWDIEPADERGRTFRLTHTVSAQGKKSYASDGSATAAWLNAQGYVLNKVGLGLDPARMAATGVLNASTLVAYNYLRHEKVGKLGGSYAVTETWLCYDPANVPDAYGSGTHALEDFTVETSTSLDDGRVRATVQGTITGLEVKDNTAYTVTSTRWTNAQAKWVAVRDHLKDRAEALAGFSFNSNALRRVVGQNQVNGIITYSYEYDNRPQPTVPGALAEIVSIVKRNPTNIIAKLPVPGRDAGPIIQDMKTKSDRGVSVNVEVTMPAATLGFTPTQPNTDALVLSYFPPGAFVERDEERWNAITGKYGRDVVYVYTAA